MRRNSGVFILLMLLTFFIHLQSAQTRGRIIRLPRTGLKKSFHAGDRRAIYTGIVWPKPRFIDNGDNTVTDKLTGLMWQKVTVRMKYSWKEAVEFCNKLTLGGHKDWRLPNRRELSSLFHYGVPVSVDWLNHHGFANLQNIWYWSSTTLAGYPKGAWYVRFQYNSIPNADKTAKGCVLAVRKKSTGLIHLLQSGQVKSYCKGDDGTYRAGVHLPAKRFIDNGNGTITDKLTGLMWQKKPYIYGRNWKKSLVYCNKLLLGGYNDWRMPNILELESLLNYKYPVQAKYLNRQGFVNVKPGFYWSANTHPLRIYYAWAIKFDKGYQTFKSKFDNFYTLAVRGGYVRRR